MKIHAVVPGKRQWFGITTWILPDWFALFSYGSLCSLHGAVLSTFIHLAIST